MEFCPICAMRLVVRKQDTEHGRLVLVCPKCGYVREAEPPEPIIRPAPSTRGEIAVIGKEEASMQTMPTAKAECARCRNVEAYWWIIQTRGADESPTQSSDARIVDTLGGKWPDVGARYFAAQQPRPASLPEGIPSSPQ